MLPHSFFSAACMKRADGKNGLSAERASQEADEKSREERISSRLFLPLIIVSRFVRRFLIDTYPQKKI